MSGIPDGLKQAAAHYQRKDLASARSVGEATLRQHPDHPVLLQLLGVVYGQLGDTAKSISTLRRAVALLPTHQQTRLNLAKLLIDGGAAAEAVAITDPANIPGEMSADLWRARGDALKATARWPEAIGAYENSVALKPDSAAAWNNLGNTRRLAGDVPGAITALERALNLDNTSLPAMVSLARALNANGRTQNAIGVLIAGLKLNPDNRDLLIDIGNSFSRLNRAQDALPYLERAAAQDPDNAELQQAFGFAYSRLQDNEGSAAAYRRAIELNPADAMAYLNYGTLLEKVNRVSEIAELLDLAAARGVPADDLAVLRANWLRREGHFAEALALVQGAKVKAPGIRIQQAYLIGSIADRLGEADLAFEGFSEMNRLTAAEPAAKEVSGAQYRERFVHQAGYTTKSWVARWRPVRVDMSRPPPAFLLGFPRSGTTLLDTFLMGHPDTHVLEEEPLIESLRDNIGSIEQVAQLDTLAVNRLRTLYFDMLAEIAPAPPGKLVIDKMPMHVAAVPLIRRVFPDAKFIFAERHPCDAVLSCFMQNFRMNQAMASFLDLKDSAVLYDRLMSYWFQCRDVFDLPVQAVRYESVVEDAEAEMRPLIAFLGLPWTDALLDNQATAAKRGSIPTPSYNQVTEKVYSRARGRWERYRKHMEPVLPILAPWCEKFGYAVD